MQLLSLLLYNLFIRLYGFVIVLISPFNPKARLWVEGRKKQKGYQVKTTNEGKRVWVHCASLGEFEQARPVIEKIKEKHPFTFIILTFFSPSGYEVRKNYALADAVLYLPLDTAENARNFLDETKPDIALFVKYEFWYHYLTELKARNIPNVLFVSIFRPNQIFFRWYGILFRNLLKNFTHIFVQNKESQTLLQEISIASKVSYDTRFDRVNQVAQNATSFPGIEKFKENSKVLVAGSTWQKDDQLLTRLIFNRSNFKEFKYIIAPHNLSEQGLSQLQSQLEINTRVEPAVQTVRLSQLTTDNATVANVLIVDTMGDLSSIYRYADIAYVGGGFNASVHNVLEAAVYGLPVIFGPNYLKSAEACDLVKLSAGFPVVNDNELNTVVTKLQTDKEFERSASDNCRQYVQDRLGGVNDIYQYIARFF